MTKKKLKEVEQRHLETEKSLRQRSRCRINFRYFSGRKGRAGCKKQRPHNDVGQNVRFRALRLNMSQRNSGAITT